jgi:hypothetical protein
MFDADDEIEEEYYTDYAVYHTRFLTSPTHEAPIDPLTHVACGRVACVACVSRAQQQGPVRKHCNNGSQSADLPPHSHPRGGDAAGVPRTYSSASPRDIALRTTHRLNCENWGVQEAWLDTPLDDSKLFRKAASGKSTPEHMRRSWPVALALTPHTHTHDTRRWEPVPLFGQQAVHHQDSAREGGPDAHPHAPRLLSAPRRQPAIAAVPAVGLLRD